MAWGVAGAIAIGGLLGWVTTHAVASLRTRCAQALGLEGFYYLKYALEHGSAADVAPLVPLALTVVAASVVIHGVSATPLMNRHHRLRGSENWPRKLVPASLDLLDRQSTRPAS